MGILKAGSRTDGGESHNNEEDANQNGIDGASQTNDNDIDDGNHRNGQVRVKQEEDDAGEARVKEEEEETKCLKQEETGIQDSEEAKIKKEQDEVEAKVKIKRQKSQNVGPKLKRR